MKIAANFMKEVPIEKREIVTRKLHEFINILPQKKTLSDIPKGYWVRQIAGTDIYKFRINSGDRILFRYEKGTIVFLSFQTHDNQIRAAKNMSKHIKLEDLNIVQEAYFEEAVDTEIDTYAQNELQHHLNQILHAEVFDDEYIELAIESNSNELLLSMEQYNCLTEIVNPTIIFGCAGSGKTSIAIRKLLLDADLSKETIYATKSAFMVEKATSFLPEHRKSELPVMTLEEMLCKELELENPTIIEYDAFIQWALRDDISDIANGFPLREIWVEINTVIKGASKERIQSRDAYLGSAASAYPEKTKKMIYAVASKYDMWLKVNHYYDYNDLAYEALSRPLARQYDHLIFDEVQELTNKQLTYILASTKNKQTVLLLGDVHQSTQNYQFDLSFIKNDIYEAGYTLKEVFINKNYRSTSEIVQAINKVKEVKQSKFKSAGISFQQLEIPVRTGVKPYFSRGSEGTMSFFRQLQQDVNAMIIVSDRREKEHFEKNGVKRVFTIEETRGLEYEKVYTYNIFTTFKNVWRTLFAETDKLNDLYQTYVNLVYVAMTRSKRHFYMIEDETTAIEKMLEAYFQPASLTAAPIDVSVDADWLKEADHLFKLKKYSQAADAYEKAGQNNRRDLCLRLYHHDQLFELKNRYECYMNLELDQCTPQHLEAAFNALEKKFGVTFKGYFEMNVRYERLLGGRHISVFIQPYMSHAEAARLLYEELQEKVLNKRLLTCKGTLFSNGIPVQLSEITGGDFNDISLVIKGNKLSIATKHLSEERKMDSFQKQLSEVNEASRLRVFGNYGYHFVEESKEKYRDKTGKDILNYIFNGEKS
ncbi:AAA family ATPase [Evansella cellulosilytica]|uniref:Uncharacterized protein n=1 Tax=Evansella cellulosilytica (strain ATCC 21833 / DSM 2522 / FERM P-1141 / JCM 9156 / N-4) TaxID=649639 RepID=E6TUV0_EVAC2|nr:AAA family ATPase [Evansella cellulosilytica]ADU32102.1 hypothetical protein Bcell_3863 [Evansella cellulosilytica DSM 2522]